MFIFFGLYFGFGRKLEKINYKHMTEKILYFHVYFWRKAVKGEHASVSWILPDVVYLHISEV